jgi:hypothetical protein
LTDNAENQSPDVTTHDIIPQNLSESTQNPIGRLRGRGRKRKRTTTPVKQARQKNNEKEAHQNQKRRGRNHKMPNR